MSPGCINSRRARRPVRVCTSALDDSKLVTAAYEHSHAAFSSKIVMEREEDDRLMLATMTHSRAKLMTSSPRERERERSWLWLWLCMCTPRMLRSRARTLIIAWRPHMCAKRVRGSWMDGIESQLCHWFKSTARVIPCWKNVRENGGPTVRIENLAKLKIPLTINDEVFCFTRRGEDSRSFFREFISSIIKIEIAYLYGIFRLPRILFRNFSLIDPHRSAFESRCSTDWRETKPRRASTASEWISL